jgi:D-methionine transport system permease protein
MENELLVELGRALWETVYMVALSTVFSGIFGFALAIVMIITGPTGLHPNKPVYKVLDLIVNLLRSFPFIILMIAIIPLTRFIAGTSIGSTASIVPLTIAATPFVARLMEGSLLEVDKGVIEAARSFGANIRQIIFGVMIKEAMPAIVLNWAVVAINLLGYSAMAGVIGGGGLGDLAIKYGYNRFQTDVMIYSVIILIVVVQIIQSVGNFIYAKIR